MNIARLLCATVATVATVIAVTIVTAQPKAWAADEFRQLTGEDREVLYKLAGIKHIGSKLIDECGRDLGELGPLILPVNLSGSVGYATTVQIGDSLCYGLAGSRLIIFKSEGKGKFRPIFDNNAGGYRVLSGSNLGVSDIKLDVPGHDKPIWRWNGLAYEFFTIDDGKQAVGLQKEIC
jgi:hypothetical protein